MQNCSPNYRNESVMYYLLDMTLEEIANELGIEYETVKSTKSKAIKELRKGAASESEEA